jgi:hypothetical protein
MIIDDDFADVVDSRDAKLQALAAEKGIDSPGTT